MRRLAINNRVIFSDSYVIAEIAGNFQSIEEAKKLVDGAVWAGADAVKLQTYRADTLASKVARYQMENTGNVSQYDLFKEGELGFDAHQEIYAYARQSGIDIFSTPSHITDVELLEQLGTSVYKIGSDDSANLEFIEAIAGLGKPLIIATGMRTIYEVDDIVNAVYKTGNKNFALLHAVTSYPTAYELANLNVIRTLMDRYPQLLIGYSDHTVGWQCSFAARVMGALIIERHFTLDRNAPGPDHILSSTPDELKLLVDAIRIFEKAKGDGMKMPVGQELINRKNNGKSVVLSKPITKGQMLTRDHLCVKRPGYGIEPKKLNELIGKPVNKSLTADAVIQWDDLGE